MFNKKTVKLELEGRDQTIELVPIPIGGMQSFIQKYKNFKEGVQKAQKKGDEKQAFKSVELVADLLSNHIVGATREDILDPINGLDFEDIGLILGKLIKMSQNPKA